MCVCVILWQIGELFDANFFKGVDCCDVCAAKWRRSAIVETTGGERGVRRHLVSFVGSSRLTWCNLHVLLLVVIIESLQGGIGMN